jgi:hypothetical protein
MCQESLSPLAFHLVYMASVLQAAECVLADDTMHRGHVKTIGQQRAQKKK